MTALRHDWSRAEVRALFELPFMDLLFRAQTVHRATFDPNKVQMSRLLSIKTGGCAEDCGYCSQSAHHKTGLKASKLMEVERVISEAKKAKAQGATRYCMGAAWRSPKARDMATVVAMIEGVKALGMETCMTLGMLNREQARALKTAQQFAFGYNPKGGTLGFILSGPVGTGKTHLIAAALSHLMLEAGVRAAYVEISLLYATIRRGFQEGKSGGEIIGPLSEVEVLAIDELGKGRGSAFELETMDELIARRYNAGKTTLFATNFSLAPERKSSSVRTAPSGYRSTAESKQAGGDPEILRERVGERIYSRLCEMCEFVELPQGTLDHRRARHELR